MNTEDSKDILDPVEGTDAANQQTREEALTDGHNPDIGTPEEIPADVAGGTETEILQREAAAWKDKYMRLYADFDNFRKRSQKERVDLFASASRDVIKDIVPIVDDFDRAIKANETVEDIAVVKEGFNLIHLKLYKRLESHGLKPINATGEVFDTDFHEAITQIPAPTPDLKGKVVDEVEKGYLLNDKVLRFSKVVIGQ